MLLRVCSPTGPVLATLSALLAASKQSLLRVRSCLFNCGRRDAPLRTLRFAAQPYDWCAFSSQ